MRLLKIVDYTQSKIVDIILKECHYRYREMAQWYEKYSNQRDLNILHCYCKMLDKNLWKMSIDCQIYKIL